MALDLSRGSNLAIAVDAAKSVRLGRKVHYVHLGVRIFHDCKYLAITVGYRTVVTHKAKLAPGDHGACREELRVHQDHIRLVVVAEATRDDKRHIVWTADQDPESLPDARNREH